jgi:hypothetical protein
VLSVAADKHAELFTAIAAHKVLRTDILAKSNCEPADHLIADQMSIAVIDRLEVIDVHHDAGHLRAHVHRLHEDMLRPGEECATRERVGELIVIGEVLQLPVALFDLCLGQLELRHGIEQLLIHIFHQR